MQNFQPRKIFLAACLCLSFTIIAHKSSAQTATNSDTTNFHFWYSSLDARAVSLAGATMADPLTSNGLYSNPGILPFNNNRPQLSLHTVYNSQHNILTENATASLLKNKDKHLLLGATLLHNGPDKISIANGDQLSFTQLNLALAYGQMITSSLSVGGRIKMDYGHSWSGDKFASDASLGFIYSPSSKISYGLVYKGTGFQNAWLGSGLSFFKTGAQHTQITTTQLPQRLELGATLRFPSLAKHPDFVLSLSNEKMFGKRGLVYKGGLEVYLLDNLTIRGGYFHSPFVEGGRLGLGLLLNSFKIDYAYSYNNLDLNGSSHLLSITVNL